MFLIFERYIGKNIKVVWWRKDRSGKKKYNWMKGKLISSKEGKLEIEASMDKKIFIIDWNAIWELSETTLPGG